MTLGPEEFISRQAFRKWLVEHPRRRFHACDSKKCPLAAAIAPRRLNMRMNLPLWAQQFITAIDDVWNPRPVTAKEALTTLDSLPLGGK